MSNTKVVHHEIEEKDLKLVVNYLTLENAVVAFFDEKDSLNLGTLAVAVPHSASKPGVSSILLGERNILLTKMLAEMLSNSYFKMALVSTHLPEMKDHRIGSLLLRLAKKMVDQTG